MIFVGELVCFFRAPPRIAWEILRSNSKASSNNAHSRGESQDEPRPSGPSLQAPSLISDAVRRLTVLAIDRPAKELPVRRGLGDNGGEQFRILRMMTDLLTVSQEQHQPRRLVSQNHSHSHSRSIDPGQRNSGIFTSKRSTVKMYNTLGFSGSEKLVATEYVFSTASSESLEVGMLVEVCKINAGVARACQRYDHERVFSALEGLLSVIYTESSIKWWANETATGVVRHVFMHLWVLSLRMGV